PRAFFYILSLPSPDLHALPPRRSSDLRARHGARAHDELALLLAQARDVGDRRLQGHLHLGQRGNRHPKRELLVQHMILANVAVRDRKSTRLNSSHVKISYAVFCLKKKT